MGYDLGFIFKNKPNIVVHASDLNTQKAELKGWRVKVYYNSKCLS